MRCLLILVLCVASATVAAADAPEPPNFSEHIKPILRQYCLKCHGEDQQESGLNLQTFGALLRGGSSGKAVEAGRASQSLLIRVLTDPDDDARMPPNSPPLPDAKIAMIRQWIDSGLRESAGSSSLVLSRDLTFIPSAGAGLKPAGPPAMPDELPAIPASKTKRPLPVLSLDVSLWAPLLAVADQEQIRLIHTENRAEIGRLAFPEGVPHVVRFSHDGAVLLAAGGRPVETGRAVLFDVRSGKRLAEIGDELDEVLAADLSPDQRLVAIGGSGRAVKVFSTTDGALKYRLTRHTEWITAVAFSPDGTKLATGDRAGGIHLWDAKSGGILLNLGEHKDAIRALDWRHDSRLLVSASEDGAVIWWDATDGFPAINKPNAHPPKRPPGTFGTIPNGVLTARFDRDGNLATAGRDRVVRLWDPGGNEKKSFRIDSGIPISVAVSNDGRFLITGDSSGQLTFRD